MNDLFPAAGGPSFPGSYPTFWDAIPVDRPAEPERPRVRPPSADDHGPVILMVEQADVG